LPYSKKTANNPCPQPDKSDQRTYYVIKVSFNIILRC
jgi:hypothetical protein